MSGLLRAGQGAVRRVAGDNSAIERFVRSKYKSLVRRAHRQGDSSLERGLRSSYVASRFRFTGNYSSRNWMVFRRGKADRRIGIYMIGSCDLPSVFAAKSLIASRLNGTCGIVRDGDVSDARSDFLLQDLSGVPVRALEEARRRLRLPSTAFEPRLFRPTFQIPDFPSLGVLPKTVTVLSIGADLTRTLYRHKEHGYLVDPGGFWLKQETRQVTGNQQKLEWMRSQFESIGTLDSEKFRESFGQVLSLLVSMGTTVVVFNMAVVSPGDQTYNFQFRRNPSSIRRMEFNDVLADLAATHGISLLNVDLILKREGIRDQVDFAHFPLERMMPVASEFNRILIDREIL